MPFAKPKYLGQDYAEFFQDQSVADVYHQRPPYPADTFAFLGSLMSDEPRSVLDAGCGMGEIARGMLTYAEHIDAVDFSAAMIARGRLQEGGDDPRLRWQNSRIEDANVTPPYAIITAGNSLGWFDLNHTMPRFASMLTANGYLAIAGTNCELEVDDLDIIIEYSANQDFVRFNLIDALVDGGLLRVEGTWQSSRLPWQPTVEDFLDYCHSQNGGAKDRMGLERADAFDKAVRERIQRQVQEGTLQIEDDRLQGSVTADITWGKPLAGR
jgi:SAM-dependent methyltransferase